MGFKSARPSIVNTHFRYQLRKVGYRVCIFYFHPDFIDNFIAEIGGMLTRI